MAIFPATRTSPYDVVLLEETFGDAAEQRVGEHHGLDDFAATVAALRRARSGHLAAPRSSRCTWDTATPPGRAAATAALIGAVAPEMAACCMPALAPVTGTGTGAGTGADSGPSTRSLRPGPGAC